jgi:PPE-repeat protein
LLSQLLHRIASLEAILTGKTPPIVTPVTPPVIVPTPIPPVVPVATQPDLAALVQVASALIQALTQPSNVTPLQTQDQIKRVISLLNALAGNPPSTTSNNALGPVNGALGQTIGNLLNGKKSAIGIIGAMITSVLQSAGPDMPLSKITSLLGATAGSAGLGSVLMPIFLSLAAWGALGKLEKWTGSTQQPPVK